MTSQSLPLVTVGMPVRNGGALFREALESVVTQDYPNLEIIISDNASTDGTAETIKEFQARDLRIVCVTQTSMLPAMDNFQHVLKHARGEFFLWAAHDDTRSQDFVSGLLKAFSDNRTVLAFPDLYIRNAPDQAGTLNVYEFENSELNPISRLRKQIMMQCFHIYGLWRLDTLRKVQWQHSGWWPDMPLMASAAYDGIFKHVSGPSFRYLEIIKSNEDRARAELGRKAHSRLRNIFGLAVACGVTAYRTFGLVPAMAAFAFVIEKYLRIAIARAFGLSEQTGSVAHV